MTDYRRKLWLNVMEDLGPPAGCIICQALEALPND